jgi:putative acetyltransferase
MKIEIRHVEPDDYKAIHQIYTQPKVVYGTLQLPYAPTQHYRELLEDSSKGSYGLVACVEDEVIGHLHLQTFPNKSRRKHAASLGMAVLEEWQGKGVGTKLMQATIEFAEQWLNISRIELSVFIDNEPAIRLYKKSGFEIEGTLRNFAYRDGQLVDVYYMSRIRELHSES